MDKQDAGHEPKRNHVEHFCETSYLGSSGNTVSPLEGLSRGYASEVCFGVCFGGMLRGLLRRDVKYLTHAFKMCQGLEVEGLRYETGVIRVWFAEHYSAAHRIRSRQELQRPVSTRSWSMQTVSAATMKLQRPVSTEAVFNLLGCIGQPDCGDGGRDGAKVA